MLNSWHDLGTKVYVVQYMFTGNILIKASSTKLTADLGEVP
jgi:ribosomal protein L27